MDFSIIIPTYNEKDVIVSTLKTLIKKFEKKFDFEILVIDDSDDETEKYVKDFAKRHRIIKFVKNNPKKKGFANSIKLGIDKASSEVVVVFMADMSDNPVTINKMHKLIKSGWDVVCGSRYTRGGKKVGGPFFQNISSFFVCKSIHLLTSIPTKDVSNAFKMYKKEVLKKIVFNPVSGVEASMETILQVYYFTDAKITEVPTVWRSRSLGYSKFKILNRAPKYFKIYLWALENRFRALTKKSLKSFYA